MTLKTWRDIFQSETKLVHETTLLKDLVVLFGKKGFCYYYEIPCTPMYDDMPDFEKTDIHRFSTWTAITLANTEQTFLFFENEIDCLMSKMII
jgi:hypothetical protein